MPLTLTGALFAHKTIAGRYTLDDWLTTNDVLARHEKSLIALPERFLFALKLMAVLTEGLAFGAFTFRDL